MKQRVSTLLALFVPVIVCVALANHFAWLNDDARNYLLLAEHLLAGKGLTIRPSWGLEYWAVFPAGYPAAIALFHLFIPNILVASKLLNAALLLASITLAASAFRLPFLLTACVFLTAPMLEIVSFTWSENMFIFGLLLAYWSMQRYLHQQGIARLLLLFFIGLLCLFTSRYIGGFVLVGFAAAVWYQRHRCETKRCWHIVFIVTVAALLFVGYLLLNHLLTGYATGLHRAPSKEEPEWLLAQSLRVMFYGLIGLLPALWFLAASGVRFKRLRVMDFPEIFPAIIIGLAYLSILFALRSNSHFEQPSSRLLLPGLLLIWLAVVHMLWHGLVHERTVRYGALIVLLSAFINMAWLYKDVVVNPSIVLLSNRKVGEIKFNRWYGKVADGSVIIALASKNPNVSWRQMSPLYSIDSLFYALIEPNTRDLKGFQGWLSRLRYHGQPPTEYWFDFREYATIDELKRAASLRAIDPAITDWVLSHFKPFTLVRCSICHDPHT